MCTSERGGGWYAVTRNPFPVLSSVELYRRLASICRKQASQIDVIMRDNTATRDSDAVPIKEGGDAAGNEFLKEFFVALAIWEFGTRS